MQYLFLWIIISVVALVIDIATSAFLFVWFTVGGIAAIIAMILQASFTVQLITFIAASAISMAIGYPLAKNALKGSIKKTATMEESYIGRELVVDEDVMEKASIKIDGIYWTVKNSGSPIKKGDRVRIVGIEGNKIVVKKTDELQSENNSNEK